MKKLLVALLLVLSLTACSTVDEVETEIIDYQNQIDELENDVADLQSEVYDLKHPVVCTNKIITEYGVYEKDCTTHTLTLDTNNWTYTYTIQEIRENETYITYYYTSKIISYNKDTEEYSLK